MNTSYAKSNERGGRSDRLSDGCLLIATSAVISYQQENLNECCCAPNAGAAVFHDRVSSPVPTPPMPQLLMTPKFLGLNYYPMNSECERET